MSSESSDDNLCDYDYIDLIPTNGPERDFFRYVGRHFEDEDAGDTFKICGVCDMRKVGSRKSSYIVYAFKYVNVDGDQSDIEYTPARELLNSYWCKWIQSDFVSDRAARASMRDETAEEGPGVHGDVPPSPRRSSRRLRK